MNCHALDRHLPTGPALRGVEGRWGQDVVELARYIRDSQNYMRAERKYSAYATQLFEQYNKKVMGRQDLSNEEIVAILQYIRSAPQE